jgi:hypothetical protein
MTGEVRGALPFSACASVSASAPYIGITGCARHVQPAGELLKQSAEFAKIDACEELLRLGHQFMVNGRLVP